MKKVKIMVLAVLLACCAMGVGMVKMQPQNKENTIQNTEAKAPDTCLRCGLS